MYYVFDCELCVGLVGVVELIGGVVFLEIFVVEDVFEGDYDGFQVCLVCWYWWMLVWYGLQFVGLYCWFGFVLVGDVVVLEWM